MNITELNEMERNAHILELTAKICTIVSLVLQVIPIFSFVVLKRSTFPGRLPLYFCLATLGLHLSCLAGQLDHKLCLLQAVGIQYFALVLTIFWFLIALNFYFVVFHLPYDHLEFIYLCVGWLIPIAFAIAPFMFNVYVEADDFNDMELSPLVIGARWECWIKHYHNVYPWPAYVFLYGWMFLMVLVGLYLWGNVLRRVYNIRKQALDIADLTSNNTESFESPYHTPYMFLNGRGENTPRGSGQIIETLSPSVLISYIRHVLFIGIFMISFLLLTTIHVLGDYGITSFTLNMLHTIILCSIGTSASLVFGFTEHNLQLWQSWLMHRLYGSFNESTGMFHTDSPNPSAAAYRGEQR